MSYFVRTGSTIRIADEKDIEVLDHLPIGIYTVVATMEGYHLKRIDDFEMPEKIYGSADKRAERILATFIDRPLSTGVHLNGVKGSGKSMTAKLISSKALAQGIPTLVVNHAYSGDGFNEFIQSIDVPAIILFDEFEKTYDKDQQKKVLTLFDGVWPTKKMFILTTNDKYLVSNLLVNRPGRVFYAMEYSNLEPVFIKEFLEDVLIDKEKVGSVVAFCQAFPFVNFDMLKAIVEEMNRWNEGINEVLEYLNISPETSEMSVDVFLTFEGERAKIASDCRVRSMPEFKYVHDLEYMDYDEEGTPIPIAAAVRKATGRKKNVNTHLVFTIDDLRAFDREKGTYTYVKQWQGRDVILEAMQKKTAQIDYLGLSQRFAL